MKIVLLESLGVSNEEMVSFENEVKALGHELTCHDRNEDIEAQKQAVKDAEMIIVANMPLCGDVIRSAKNLKYINIAFTGVDHVDIAAAKEMGVLISNSTGYSNQSVAELAICMMLTMLRNVREVEDRVRNNGTMAGLMGSELSGKTVGIIGLGEIGGQVASLAKAFGCKVAAYKRNPSPQDGIEFLSLDELLQKSDIISLHCPANKSTENLISKRELSLMKPSSLLINTARGAVVNGPDLAEALNNNVIAGAGIDVFDIEPPLPTAHPLLNAKNILVTPHIAFASKESMIKRKNIVLENVKAFSKGEHINKI